MLVVEKKHHIKATITGEGTETIAALVRERYPDAELLKDNSDSVEWKNSDLAKEIKITKTPGKLLRAYRERSGFTVVELAQMVGTRYPNISAMENDRRSIGLSMARKLGGVLGVHYGKFLE